MVLILVVSVLLSSLIYIIIYELLMTVKNSQTFRTFYYLAIFSIANFFFPLSDIVPGT